MLSNLPPGCSESDLPGYYDKNVSYEAEIDIYASVDLEEWEDVKPEILIPRVIGSLSCITPDIKTFTIDNKEVDSISFCFSATVEGDAVIDPRYEDQIEEDLREQVYDDWNDYFDRIDIIEVTYR